MMGESAAPDDKPFEPTPIVQRPGLGQQVRRARRRQRLVALWASVGLLLLLQAALALHLSRRKGEPAAAAVAPAQARRDARPEISGELASTRPVRPVDAAAADTAAADAAARPTDAAAPLLAAAKRRRVRVAGNKRPAARTSGGAKREGEAMLSLTRPADDLTVPKAVSGDPAKGERLFRMGCGLCHGSTAKAVSPGRFSARQWSTYFARGVHGQHDRLRPHFTRAELADIKAYLIHAPRER